MPNVTNQGILFGPDRKLGDINHVAKSLVVSGMQNEEVYKVLNIINESQKLGLNDQELFEIVQKHSDKKPKTLAEEIREYVMSSNGVFLSSDIVNFLDLSSRVLKKNLSQILNRLKDDKIIEKYGNKNGCWRKIDKTIEIQNWWEEEAIPLSLRFPLGIEKYVRIFKGNIILMEGQKSQGKSSFAIEFCRMNKRVFPDKPLYQNVEMSNNELLDRFKSYGDIMTLEEWQESIVFIRQTSEWWDKIIPDGLNVIDYLIEYKEPYLIADFIWRIHQKLKNGIALIVVQRDPLKPYGTGGGRVRDIPRLVISLIHHKVRLEDIKSFLPTERGNPTGMERKYKQANWWNFIPVTEWEYTEEEKYTPFLNKGKKEVKNWYEKD